MKKSKQQPPNTQFPDEQKEAILRAILSLLPGPGANPALLECAGDVKRLSEDLQAGKSVTQSEVGETLARTYTAYSQLLQDSSGKLPPSDQQALELAARGYALLAEGSRSGDFSGLAEGLKTIREAAANLDSEGRKPAKKRKGQAR